MPDPLDEFRPDGRRRHAFHNAALAAGKRLEQPEHPPTYATAQALTRLGKPLPRPEEGQEELPPYSCSLYKEGILEVDIELCKPFTLGTQWDWEPRCVVVRGTKLSIYKTSSKNVMESPDRLIRGYSLQHAEVGLASDLSRIEYEPVTRKAAMIPKIDRARHAAQHPDWFVQCRYSILRLRVEEQQILLSCPSRHRLYDWIEAICAGIDLAHPLDERASARGLATPWSAFRTASLLANRRFVEQQAAIIAQLYPQLNRDEPARSESQTTEDDALVEAMEESRRDAEDESERRASTSASEDEYEARRNFSITSTVSGTTYRTDSRFSSLTHAHRLRPSIDRTDSEASIFQPAALSATGRHYMGGAAFASLDLFGEPMGADDGLNDMPGNGCGKWMPSHDWTAHHELMFRRRCMPTLYRNTPRAEGIICVRAARSINASQAASHAMVRMQINWKMQSLKAIGPVPLPIIEAAEAAARQKQLKRERNANKTTPMTLMRKMKRSSKDVQPQRDTAQQRLQTLGILSQS